MYVKPWFKLRYFVTSPCDWQFKCTRTRISLILQIGFLLSVTDLIILTKFLDTPLTTRVGRGRRLIQILVLQLNFVGENLFFLKIFLWQIRAGIICSKISQAPKKSDGMCLRRTLVAQFKKLTFCHNGCAVFPTGSVSSCAC